MQFIATIFALAAGASMIAAQVNPALCGGRTAQCCELNVLDLASITCENRMSSMNSCLFLVIDPNVVSRRCAPDPRGV